MYNIKLLQLGERIREERNKRQLTQENLAEKLDVSASYVGQIERGERNPTLNTLILIANSFDVTVDYLLRDSLTALDYSTDEDWMRLTQRKTSEEKKILIEVIEAFDRYRGR